MIRPGNASRCQGGVEARMASDHDEVVAAPVKFLGLLGHLFQERRGDLLRVVLGRPPRWGWGRVIPTPTEGLPSSPTGPARARPRAWGSRAPATAAANRRQ